MDSVRRKAMRLCTEVISYFVENQAKKMQVELETLSGTITITVSGYLPARPNDLEVFIAALDEPRQPEMDDYYDGLLGGNSLLQGYHLLGAMVDTSKVTYENGSLSVHLIRKQQASVV